MYSKSDKLRQKVDELFERGLSTEDYRSEWRRDYARLIHSPSFRRLQGKTQLFPGVESDYFRNRLTHSLEVAQIAKSIAIKLNYEYNAKGEKDEGESNVLGVSEDIVEFAGLAHDLGHPPFGHQGEEELDDAMKRDGGFEANAQTIRILARLEKKFPIENIFDKQIDKRVGLNLCARTIASILKYDFVIPDNILDRKGLSPEKNEESIRPVKGYYKCDETLIESIKARVLGDLSTTRKFKTIECSIMDIADDIAYSTYDLEDGFKAGFISPMDLLYPSPVTLKEVTKRVNKNLKKEKINRELDKEEILHYIRNLILPEESDAELMVSLMMPEEIKKLYGDIAHFDAHGKYLLSKNIAGDGSNRTSFTSSIVGLFLRGTELDKKDYNHPALYQATLNEETRIQVEILKIFTYISQISAPRLKIAEYRGKEIVRTIFNVLTENNYKNAKLLPKDVQIIFKQAPKKLKKRVVCDFIAGMTDRYAIEFYGRLKSENPRTIFKPFW